MLVAADCSCLALPTLKYVYDCTAVPFTLEKHLQHEQSQQPLQCIILDTRILCDLVFSQFTCILFILFPLTFPGLIFIFAEQTY